MRRSVALVELRQEATQRRNVAVLLFLWRVSVVGVGLVVVVATVDEQPWSTQVS